VAPGDADDESSGAPVTSTSALTLVENSLNPVEEIMSVRGAHAVPPLVQPTGGP
jgi:hypothetical protein